MLKNDIINKYIIEAEEIIKSNNRDSAKEFVIKTVSVFKNEIDNIDMHLDFSNFYKYDIDKNYINDVKIIKSHLENYDANLKSGLINGKDRKQVINVSTLNNNTNNNSNVMSVNMSIEDVRKEISDNTYLGDTEKEELLQKLKEIEELQKSKESKPKKWGIAKGILSFILDKGADIAIMYISQILKAIQ